MKTVFAKDIPFIKKSTAKSPSEYESMVVDQCKSNGWIYGGFVLPIHKPFQRTKVYIKVGDKVKTPLLQRVLMGKFTGKDHHPTYKKPCMYTEHEYIQVSTNFFNKIGWDVLGLAEPYRGITTHLKLKCNCHGKIYNKADLFGSRNRGSLTCPLIRGAITALSNGKQHALMNKDTHRPVIFYVFRVGEKFLKFGITTRKNPLRRMYETQRYTDEILSLEYSHTFDCGWKAGDLESGIKKHIKGKRISRKLMSRGYTETLPISKMDDVKKFIQEYIYNNSPEPIYFDADFEINPEDYITEDDIERDFAMMHSMPLAELEPEDLELDLSPLEAA